MATTTTAPYLYSGGWQEATADPGRPWAFFSKWRGVLLSTGDVVEVYAYAEVADIAPGDQEFWDGLYGDAYGKWTELTGDTTHSANPVVIAPP